MNDKVLTKDCKMRSSQFSYLCSTVHILQSPGQADHEGLVLLPVLAPPPDTGSGETRLHLAPVTLPPLPGLQVRGVVLGWAATGAEIEETVPETTRVI